MMEYKYRSFDVNQWKNYLAWKELQSLPKFSLVVAGALAAFPMGNFSYRALRSVIQGSHESTIHSAPPQALVYIGSAMGTATASVEAAQSTVKPPAPATVSAFRHPSHPGSGPGGGPVITIHLNIIQLFTSKYNTVIYIIGEAQLFI